MNDWITVTMKLAREDSPLLFDALAGLPKGVRRTGRLRTLAIEGLQREAAAATRSQLVTETVTSTTSSPEQSAGRVDFEPVPLSGVAGMFAKPSGK